MKKWAVIIGCLIYSQTALADPFYCTENNEYINVGMNVMDVRQACGTPQSVQKSQRMGTRKVPVAQLTFNIATATTGSYAGTFTPGIQSSNFQVNTGPLTTLIVEVSNNKITDISLNGQSAQSVSICGGGSFGVGDPPASAINSCGSPVSENDTYKNVSTGQEQQVETWTYQPADYQPAFQLIFVDGALSQINS